MKNKLMLDELEDKKPKKENKFLSRMQEEIEEIDKNEGNNLMIFLRENFNVIEEFIEKHKNKSKGKVYENLSNIIRETEERFKNHKVSDVNLAKYISKIRLENNCRKQIRRKNKEKNDK